jgi:hypothetical protein
MELKKLILPVGIIAGIGILYFMFKGKRKSNPNPTPTPAPADDSTKQAVYDTILNTLATMYLGGEKHIRPDLDIQTQTQNANIRAIESFNCMNDDLRKMSKTELNMLLDYLQNGEPQEVTKLNELMSVSKKYPSAFSDHPCNYTCTDSTGRTYSSALPCDVNKEGATIEGAY